VQPDQPLRVNRRIGAQQVHDLNFRSGARDAAHSLPQHHGVVEVMQEAIREHDVETLGAKRSAREHALDKTDSLFQAGFFDSAAPEGEHCFGAVHASDIRARVSSGEAHGHVGRSASQVRDFAFVEIGKAAAKILHERVVRLGEIGLRVGFRLRRIIHELRFGYALHRQR
jgi:hypothetical protein